MGVVESLAAWGIVRAAEVVEIAAGAGLDLAAAATMLELESGGGHNVWGHDGVATGGFYVTGGEVTRGAYLAWLPHRQRLGSQGVGPTQLTWGPLQDQADRLGGCWDWRINLTVGCRHLAGLVQMHGLRNGFRAYNGSGPDAEAYADKAMRTLQRWIVALPQTGQPLTPQQQEDEMAFTEQEEGEILEAARSVVFGIEGQRGAGPMAMSVADLRDRATDTARGMAVLVESVRNLTDTVEGMARLLAVSAPAPMPAAAEIHYPTLVSEMLAKLGLPQQSTSERSPT